MKDDNNNNNNNNNKMIHSTPTTRTSRKRRRGFVTSLTRSSGGWLGLLLIGGSCQAQSVVVENATSTTTTTTTTIENAATAESCFARRPLSCQVPQTTGDDRMDVNRACLAAEQVLQAAAGGRDVRRVQSVADVEQHQAWLDAAVTVEDDLCYGIQNAYHKCWWCVQAVLPEPYVRDDFCTFQTCEPPSVANTGALLFVSDAQTLDATCDEMRTVAAYGGKPATIEFCVRAEQAAFGCPDLFCQHDYLGADTVGQKRTLVWLARAAAFLTLFGAGQIVWDVWMNPQHRATVYHQLLVGMAVFDACTGLAWGLSTLPVPESKFWIHGARGNTATCTLQGFVVQLGYTSVFYNVSLAIYYLLVIVYTYKEYQLVQLRPYLHGIPLSVGVLLAVGGIPFYDWFEYGCHFLPPPQGTAWPVYVFAVGPLMVAIGAILSCMAVVYYRVRKQAHASRRWTLGTGAASGLQTRVFYQCLWYAASFLVSWPILFAVYLASVDVRNDTYGLSLLVAFLAPIQGFNNYMVYLRPKYNHWRTLVQKHRRQQNGSSSAGAPSGSSFQNATFSSGDHPSSSTQTNSSLRHLGSGGSFRNLLFARQFSFRGDNNSDPESSSSLSRLPFGRRLTRLGSSRRSMGSAATDCSSDGEDNHNGNNNRRLTMQAFGRRLVRMGSSRQSLGTAGSNHSNDLVDNDSNHTPQGRTHSTSTFAGTWQSRAASTFTTTTTTTTSNSDNRRDHWDRTNSRQSSIASSSDDETTDDLQRRALLSRTPSKASSVGSITSDEESNHNNNHVHHHYYHVPQQRHRLAQTPLVTVSLDDDDDEPENSHSSSASFDPNNNNNNTKRKKKDDNRLRSSHTTTTPGSSASLQHSSHSSNMHDDIVVVPRSLRMAVLDVPAELAYEDPSVLIARVGIEDKLVVPAAASDEDVELQAPPSRRRRSSQDNNNNDRELTTTFLMTELPSVIMEEVSEHPGDR